MIDQRNGVPLMCALLLTAAAVAYVGESHVDDTFIFMRYAANVINGGGMSFNAHEPTYGVTSIAWFALMTPLAAAATNSIGLWKAASWACYGILAWYASSVALASQRRGAVIIAAVLMVEPYLFRWSGTGMENSFASLVTFAALVQWIGIVDGVKPRWYFGVLLGCMPLVRPGLAILAAVIALEWLWMNKFRREWLIACAAATAMVLAVCASMAWLTGSWVPDTAAAKAVAARQAMRGYALRQAAIIMFSGAGAALLFACVAMRDSKFRTAVRPVLVSVAVVGLYLGYQNQLVSTRYATSLTFPLVAISFLITLRTEWRRPSVRLLWTGQLALTVIVLAYLYPGTRTNEGRDVMALAASARNLTSETDRIATTEIGAFGFYSGRYVIDLVGLTDPASVEWIREHGNPDVTDSIIGLEPLLAVRRASYYLDNFSSGPPPLGLLYEFVPVIEALVTRNNMSGARQARWRLYRLVPRKAELQ